MARHRFGGVADYVISVGTGNAATLQIGASVTCWNAAVGGTQYTDLTDTDGITPITGGTLTADSTGAVPEFFGPDGITSLYFDAASGNGPRRRALATDIGDGLTSVQNSLDEHVADADASYLRKGLGVFQVTGLTGDGVTDDAPTIQAVLDAAHSAGGGIVIVPAGRTYGLGTYLVPRSGVTLMAYGATFKALSAGLLRNFVLTDSYPGYTGEGDLAILGGVWDANAADGVGGGAVTDLVNAFTIGHCEHVTIRDVTIRNVSGAHGLEINASRDVSVLNCRFEGFKDNTVDQSRPFSEAIQLDYAVVDSGSIGPADNTSCKGILIQGCGFGASDRLPGFGRAVGSHTSVGATTWNENVQVIGCRIEATAQEGIRAYGWKSSVIADNVVTGTGLSGILVTGPDPTVAGYVNVCQDITVHGNTVAGPASSAASPIRVVGWPTALPVGVKISGNEVISSPSTGIYVSYAQQPQISDNQVRGAVSSSVYAINCTSPQIAGNRSVGAVGAALGIDTCTGGSMTGNVIDGAASGTGHGCLVANSSSVMVSGNRVSGVRGSGIRVTSSASRCTVLGNAIERGGVTPLGLDVTASATDCVIIGNALTGGGWTAGTAFNLVGTRQRLDWTGLTAQGDLSSGLNLAS